MKRYRLGDVDVGLAREVNSMVNTFNIAKTGKANSDTAHVDGSVAQHRNVNAC